MTIAATQVGTDVARLAHERKWDELRGVLAGLHPADIADLIIDLPSSDEGIVFRLLPRDLASRTFAYLPRSYQRDLIESLSRDEVRAILAGIAPDDRVCGRGAAPLREVRPQRAARRGPRPQDARHHNQRRHPGRGPAAGDARDPAARRCRGARRALHGDRLLVAGKETRGVAVRP